MFDWKEYLSLARELNTPGISKYSEAAQRSAVSRAYYSAYCWARNYARDHQNYIPSKSGDDHRKLIDHFKGRNPWRVANRLEMLLQLRRLCDYEDEVSNLNKIAENAISEAQKIQDDLI